MTQEEKAKAYDNVREKIVVRFGSNVANEIFSEYEESEDERIRKDLILYLKSVLSNKKYGDKFIESWIAWLEKQAEQKPVVIIPKFRVGDKIKTSNEESLTITKIDEKGYWSEDLFICDFDEECLWDLVEQKPTEEYNITGIKSRYAQGKLGEMIKRKLEMEKQSEQKPAEWNEEDKEKMMSIFLGIEAYFPGIIYGKSKEEVLNWFKSLNYQNKWIPSDEQMEALHYVTNFDYGGHKAMLVSLYEQLKKLRKEV